MGKAKARAVGAPIDEMDASGFDPIDTVGSIVRDVYLGYRVALHKELRLRSITLPQWTFLRILWKEEGLTQKVLSERVSIHPSTTVDTLRSLEQIGLIERRPDPSDGRAVRVFLTAGGKRMKAKLLPCALHVNKLATDGLSEREVSDLRRLLAKVRSNLESAMEI
ncbi:MarR family winged helix-turn-helix transcriptional regulator [Cupriavidus sp. L7L]|uniref:MarR family winged helix-turn-helix transcriptional regulator n=1 Tax=Cupriavidus sp. L7L TaxID=2546443 RepID=UPI00105674A6|nr:MarR family winged helix-turn-helix transcriptional regulator [Cupriavidus sp. L7L]TDF64931.1 MarR family transcriptional regulator [Cupriavidus sp. L7L]